jgi:hypothetical protein
VSWAPTDSEAAQCLILNLSLRAARQCAAGQITPGELAAIRRHIDAAWSHLTLAAVAVDPPALLALANHGPRR